MTSRLKRVTTTAVSLSLIALGSGASAAVSNDASQKIIATHSGSQLSRNAPAEYFTGSVRIDPLFQEEGPSHRSASYVTFEPGARSAWHTHPLGQTLIVTARTGWIQQEGGEKQEIKPGDVIWIPPGVKHWHGATATDRMTHIAIQEAVDGKNVNWMEKLTEEQYNMTTNPNTPGNGGADAVRTVAPALERYTETILDEVWKRPDLSARDRSLVTVAALIARNQASQLSSYLNRALDNGVKAAELSEVITHLAFYSGWGNAMAAAAVAKEVFQARGIGADQLPPAAGPLLPMDEPAESKRAASVEQNVGPVSPGVVQYTSDPLFHDLWRRPALAPRDRSLVTVSALIASGQVAQITFHLNRAMDNGLTKAQASEVLTHLLFYAGWPNVMSAVPIAKEVFQKRPQ
ncbi:MAG: carboxymuconolactone decarboxylase family protein [Verrucomicrobia bacterium]|nr:carboxymuconolactone decarboxylase family protein [Verrucomicrobiota bacterium]